MTARRFTLDDAEPLLTRAVTLADKAVYQFAAKCDFSKLKAGEKVAITYAVKGKVNEASAITAG